MNEFKSKSQSNCKSQGSFAQSIVTPLGRRDMRRGGAWQALRAGFRLSPITVQTHLFPSPRLGLCWCQDDLQLLGNPFTQLLTQDDLRQRLRAQSLQAYRAWFAWDQIAQLLSVLEGDSTHNEAMSGEILLGHQQVPPPLQRRLATLQ